MIIIKNGEFFNKKVKNNTVIICISILLAIFIITIGVVIGVYLNTQSQKEQLQMKLDNENSNETDRQEKLQACITSAKASRSNLWKANCTEQKDGSCTIPSGSALEDWIEERYQKDLENCYELYGS